MLYNVLNASLQGIFYDVRSLEWKNRETCCVHPPTDPMYKTLVHKRYFTKCLSKGGNAGTLFECIEKLKMMVFLGSQVIQLSFCLIKHGGHQAYFPANLHFWG